MLIAYTGMYLAAIIVIFFILLSTPTPDDAELALKFRRALSAYLIKLVLVTPICGRVFGWW